MSRMGIVRVTRHARRVLRFYLLVVSLCMLFLVLRIVSSGILSIFLFVGSRSGGNFAILFIRIYQ